MWIVAIGENTREAIAKLRHDVFNIFAGRGKAFP
jgi:hypothetical protein